MRTKLFYFSATGNSLEVARCIALKLEETELISIPKVLGKAVDIEGERIGFIFPVHAWGMPQIVERFIKSLKLSSNQYIFAIVTCAGTQGGTLLQLKHLLQKRGGRLAAGFAIRAQSHSPLVQVPIEKFVIWLNRHNRPVSIENRQEEILKILREKKSYKPEIGAKCSAFLGTAMLHRPVLKALHQYSCKFFTNQNCGFCGTCEKVCPRANIRTENGKIIWGNECELCFACLNWCPKKAISIQGETVPLVRSHHPKIKVSDIIKGNG